MKRRSFIGALVATFATPAKMLEPPNPMVMPWTTGFVSISSGYAEMFRVEYVGGEPLFKGEIGQYEGIRIIRSRA